jgi:hypothetical protein
MGLTYDQAKSLGLEEYHPAASGGKSRGRELLDALDPGPRRPAATGDGMNKTETAFWHLLSAMPHDAIRRVSREPLTFRLAGRTRYTPDFGVWLWAPNGAWHVTMIEVKGYMRDDAAVKLKVAAEMYPEFAWLLVVRDGRHSWLAREVTAHGGIGRDPIHVPWIHT